MPADRLDVAQLRPWVEVRFARAGGPGGQNVNKVSTQVALLFDFRRCEHLSEALKARIGRCLANRLARDGRLRVVSRRARTQAANRALAERRLIELLEAAARTPKVRRPTAPTRLSRERRLAAKRRRARLKHLRATGAMREN